MAENIGTATEAVQVSAKDIAELKELVKDASVERKTLQMLVEYIEKNKDVLLQYGSATKKIEEKMPVINKFVEKIDQKTDDVRNLEIRIRESQRIATEMDSSIRTSKRDMDGVNLLAEKINGKIKALSQQRVLVEKANEEAGRLNVLIWDMESKMKKLSEENKLVKKIRKEYNQARGDVREDFL